MGAVSLLANFETLANAAGGVGELRELILELAVHGMLVPQDAHDEPVTELLRRIGETKTMASSEAIADGRFELPASWAWVRLGGVSSYIQRGKGPMYVEKSKVPVVSQKCIQWRGFTLARARYVDPNSLSKYAPERYLQPGDLLLNSTGTGTIGRINVYPDLSASWPQVVADSHVTVIRLVEIEPGYMWCWLASPLVQGEIDEISTGTTKQKELGTGTIKEYLAPLPPLAEQRRIVSKVDELMSLCDELEARQERRHGVRRSLQISALEALSSADSPEALVEAWDRVRNNWVVLTSHPDSIPPLRQAILELAIRGRLVPQDPNDVPASKLLKRTASRPSVEPFLLPNAWEWAFLNDITDVIQIGPFGSLLHKRDYVSDGIPLINPQNIRDGKIEPTTSKTVTKATLERLSTYVMRTGDVVMGRRGEMGKCAVVTDRENGWLCGTGSLFLRFVNGVLPSFIAEFLRSPHARSALLSSAVGSTMSNLSQKALKSILVGVPPSAEQRRIVTKVDELMALCDELEDRLQAEQETSARLASAWSSVALSPTGLLSRATSSQVAQPQDRAIYT